MSKLRKNCAAQDRNILVGVIIVIIIIITTTHRVTRNAGSVTNSGPTLTSVMKNTVKETSLQFVIPTLPQQLEIFRLSNVFTKLDSRDRNLAAKFFFCVVNTIR